MKVSNATSKDGTFGIVYTCKHSVRFNAIDDASKEVATAIYLANQAYSELGNPKQITVTVKVAKKE